MRTFQQQWDLMKFLNKNVKKGDKGVCMHRLYEKYCTEFHPDAKSFDGFMEEARSAGLYVRESANSKRRKVGRSKNYVVSRNRSTKMAEMEAFNPLAKEAMAGLSYRRSLEEYMMKHIQPGEKVLADDIYDGFRAQYQLTGLSDTHIGRQVNKSRFRIFPSSHEGQSARKIQRWL